MHIFCFLPIRGDGRYLDTPHDARSNLVNPMGEVLGNAHVPQALRVA